MAGAEDEGGALPLRAGDGESPAVDEAAAEAPAEEEGRAVGEGAPLPEGAPGLPVLLTDAVRVACGENEERPLPLACALPEALPLTEAGELWVAKAEPVAAPAVGVCGSDPLPLPLAVAEGVPPGALAVARALSV